VHDLVRRPGETRDVELDVPAPADLRNAVIGFEEGATIEIDARLESLHDGILVSGSVAGDIVGECVRCLTPVRDELQVEFQELFAYAGESDFDYHVRDDAIDLEQVVRDTVVPALPFQPVCREDCEGLCPECGVRLLDVPGHEHEAPTDPRWAALHGLASDEETSK